MPVPPPSLQCASHSFIARIADPARRGKAIDLTQDAPGFPNAEWQRGAYTTTLARNKGEALSQVALAVIAKRVSTWPTNHRNKAAFDKWHASEIYALGVLIARHSSGSFWSYGRAQKYINILLKYACAAYHCGLPHFAGYSAANTGLGPLTEHLHAPVDRFTLKHTAQLPTANKPWRYLSWSKNLDARRYASIQGCLNAAAAAQGISPIHYEMVYVW